LILSASTSSSLEVEYCDNLIFHRRGALDQLGRPLKVQWDRIWHLRSVAPASSRPVFSWSFLTLFITITKTLKNLVIRRQKLNVTVPKPIELPESEAGTNVVRQIRSKVFHQLVH
jgi:hypothetical protein